MYGVTVIYPSGSTWTSGPYSEDEAEERREQTWDFLFWLDRPEYKVEIREWPKEAV